MYNVNKMTRYYTLVLKHNEGTCENFLYDF